MLTRRTVAIERLGAIDVLCTDKTGTLTQNRMRVASLVPGLDADESAHEVGAGELPEAVHEIVEFGILASQRDPYDAMEIAFHELGAASLASTEHLHASWTLVREYPLSPALLSVSQVWRDPEGSGYVIAAKGAPEAIVRSVPPARRRDRACAGASVAAALAKRRACGCSGSRGPTSRRVRPRRSSTTTNFAGSGWSGSPTRSARACPRPSTSARRRASGS